MLGIPFGYDVQRFQWGSIDEDYYLAHTWPFFGLWPEIGYTGSAHGKNVDLLSLGVGPVVSLGPLWIHYAPRFVSGSEEKVSRIGFGHGLSATWSGAIGIEVSEMYLGGGVRSHDRAVQLLLDPGLLFSTLKQPQMGGRPLRLEGRQVQAALASNTAWG